MQAQHSSGGAHAVTTQVEQMAQDLRGHLWFDPECEQAVAAVIAACPNRSELLHDLLPPGLVEHLAADPSRRPTARESDRLLLRLAALTSPEDWQPPAARQIHAARVRFATAWPQQAADTRHWHDSGPAVVAAMLAALPRAKPAAIACLARAVADLSLTAELRRRALAVLTAALAEATPTDADAVATATADVASAPGTEPDLEPLLGLLPRATPAAVAAIARTVAARAGNEPAAAWRALVDRIADAHALALPALAESAAQLADNQDQRVRTREEVLAAVVAGRSTAPELIAAALALGASPDDRGRGLQAVLAALPQAPSYATTELVRAAIDLAAHDDHTHQALSAVLAAIPRGHPSAAHALAQGAVQLATTPDRRAEALGVLLGVLPRAHPSATPAYAQAAVDLGAESEQCEQVRAAVLAAFPHANHFAAARLARLAIDLGAEPEQRGQVLQVLLAALPGDDGATAEALTHALLHVVTTADERSHCLDCLLAATGAAKPGAVAPLVRAAGELAQSSPARERVSQGLLTALAQATPATTPLLARAAGPRDAHDPQREQAFEALLAQVAASSHTPEAPAEAASALAADATQRQRLVTAVLGALPQATPSSQRTLVQVLLALAPTADQRDAALAVLVPLLPVYEWASPLVRALVDDRTWVQWVMSGFAGHA